MIPTDPAGRERPARARLVVHRNARGRPVRYLEVRQRVVDRTLVILVPFATVERIVARAALIR